MREQPLSKESVLESLRTVNDPRAQRDVVSLGYVRSVAVCDGVVRVSYELPASAADEPAQQALRSATRNAVLKLPGSTDVNVEFAVAQPRASSALPGVRHVVAVGAGKGGVGKSTVAVLAAIGLRRKGFSAALLDADVYGPSIPKLTRTEDAQPRALEDGRIEPPRTADGMKVMSIGHIVPPEQAIVWRGPMAQKYVKEFLERGDWGELDYLIVDLPPGTGDIPLTLAQSIPLAGAVIVCTPQDVALLDAVKALRMYQKLGVPPLGIVENMSYYVCPHCGQRDEIFSHGGARQAAAELGVPFLGEIPLNVSIRVHGDAGTPDATFTATPPHVATALEEFVAKLSDEVESRARQRMPLPQIRVH